MSREICECDICGSKQQPFYLSDDNEILCEDCEAEYCHQQKLKEEAK